MAVDEALQCDVNTLMATIVLHKPTNTHYVLVGAGHAQQKVTVARRGIAGTTSATQPRQMLAVADAEGAIDWAPTDEFVVVTVDGTPPGALLAAVGPYR